MIEPLKKFENIVRRSPPAETESTNDAHPFDERNIHPSIASVSIKLFDDGHYSQSTFEAFKFLDNEVKRVSGINESGMKLMMAAFNEKTPKIQLNELKTASDEDEQSGFRFMFAGAMAGVRNPRGHEIRADTIDLCLDHLSLASVLLRTLEARTAP